MKKNLGPFDRFVRLMLGNLLVFFVTFGVIIGEGASYLLAAGVASLITSLISFCPLYALLGISTKKV